LRPSDAMKTSMQTSLQTPITDQDRALNERDGVVCLKQMFDTAWIDFLGTAVEDAMADPGPYAEEYTAQDGSGRFFGDLELAERRFYFRRFAMASPAAEIAGRVMDTSKTNFFYDQLLVKEPGTTERTPWHQDQPYWAVRGRQVCSVWLPLDPIGQQVGVEYVCGTHRWEAYRPYHFMDGSPYEETGLPPLPDIEADRAKHPIVSFAMEPGDCLVFQSMIVYGAPGNQSRHRRRALTTRWTGDDARYDVRSGEVSIPMNDPGLQHGDVLNCVRFPVVWRR
jgi:ectoine hydroxylase-related dioxygenase (phytanoyl-CoA dioxygenase family)